MGRKPVNAVKGKQGFQPTVGRVPAPTPSQVPPQASTAGESRTGAPESALAGIYAGFQAERAGSTPETDGNPSRIAYADRIVTEKYTLTERASVAGTPLWTARIHETGQTEEFDSLGAAGLWADRQIGERPTPASPAPPAPSGNPVVNRSDDRLVTQRYTVRRGRAADGSRVYGVVIHGSGQVEEFDTESAAVRWADGQI